MKLNNYLLELNGIYSVIWFEDFRNVEPFNWFILEKSNILL